MQRIALALATAAVLVATGCSRSAGTGAAPAATRSEGQAAGVAARPTAARPVRNLLVFMVENHSLAQMRDEMPYTAGIASDYGYADRYRAITHPSLPNYLAIAGGSTHGVTDDDLPQVNAVPGSSVFGLALAHGRTAALYAEGMPGTCMVTSEGDYAVKHNPWAYYPDEEAGCARHDVPFTRFSGDVTSGHLPNVGLVVPNLCNDAHDCDLATADAWLRTQLRIVLAGPDWRSGRLAVVITADEDDRHADNQVLTAVLHPSLHGQVVHEPLTHYSLSRALSEVGGGPPLGAAAEATSLLTAFDLQAAR